MRDALQVQIADPPHLEALRRDLADEILSDQDLTRTSL
jgi:hypothetical protein